MKNSKLKIDPMNMDQDAAALEALLALLAMMCQSPSSPEEPVILF